MSYNLTETIRVFERKDWRARTPKPMDSQSRPKEAFIHHTDDHQAEKIGTLEEQCAAMRAVQNFHMDVRGWSDIAYHYIVFQPYETLNFARIFEGRLVKNVPAAQELHNTGTAAICVFGNFDNDDELDRNTRYAIEVLLSKKPAKTGLGSIKTLGGHRDVVATECPGDSLYKWIPRIAKAANLEVFKK